MRRTSLIQYTLLLTILPVTTLLLLLAHLSSAQTTITPIILPPSFCTFCENGVTNPDLIVPQDGGGIQSTCAEVYLVALTFSNDDELCASLKEVEGSCCPIEDDVVGVVTLPTLPLSSTSTTTTTTMAAATTPASDTTTTSSSAVTESPTATASTTPTSKPVSLSPTTLPPTTNPTNVTTTTSSPTTSAVTTIAPSPPPTPATVTGTATISGVAFYDSNNNGNRESMREYGVWDIQSLLYSCADNDDADASAAASVPLSTTSTSTQGEYQFNNLVQGSYYIQFIYPIYYLLGDVWNGDPATPNVQNSVNPDNGKTNCFTLLEDNGGDGGGGVFEVDVALVFNSNPNPVPPPSPAPAVVVTTVAPTVVGVTPNSPPPFIGGVTTTLPPMGVSTNSTVVAATSSPTTVPTDPTASTTVAATASPTATTTTVATNPTSTVAATASPSTTTVATNQTSTVAATASPTAADDTTTTTTTCTFCQDGIPDPMVTISTGQTCGSIKLISADHLNGSEICKLIQEGETICCPKPIMDNNACTFCPDGIPNEDFMPVTAGGISCSEVQALAAKETVDSAICSILKQPESLCCPPPPSSLEDDDPSCSFCDDGMPDPEYVVPGTEQTCTEMKSFASNEVSGTILCGAFQLVEGSCCPDLPTTTNTTLSPTSEPTPSPTSFQQLVSPTTSPQPTPEFTSKMCTFCEDGMIDTSLEIPDTQGRTCGSQKDRAENLNGLTALCRTIQESEDVCCPEPIVNPCSFCEEGIDNLDLELPESGGRTCGTVNALAATMEQGSELCTTLQQAESKCCPLPAGFCTFCPEGILDPTIVLSNNGQSCGFMQAAVASVQSDSDLCSEFKAMESQCCPVSVPPADSSVASTKPPTADVDSPISPSPSDELVGPVTRSGIEMLLVGIENTEKVTVWQENTAAFIVDYFKKNPGFVYDVDVNVTIMFQTGTTAVESVYPRGPIRRKLQETSTPSVIITYVQTTTYKSKYPDSFAFDEDYIAEKPFEEDSEGYIAMLKRLSSYYDPVSKVTVTVPLPTPPPTPPLPASVIKSPEASDNTSDNNKRYVIIGVVCGVVLIAVLAGLLIVRKRKRLNQDIAPQTVTRQIESDEDLESRDISGAFDSKGALDAALSNLTTCEVIASGSEGMVHVVAPEGKLGIVVATSPEGGPAYVSDLREESPLLGKLHLGDKIIAIDDDDVQQLSPIEVSKLIARKSKNPQRKFTILRKEEQQQGPSADEHKDASVVTSPASRDTKSEHTVTIIAPKGKLGVVIQNREGGGPYVSELRKGSVLVGKILLEDQILSIDDQDVRELKAFHISKILASKHQNSERKIVVLRGANE